VEDWLDDVSRGERDWVKVLRDFYGPFALALQAAPGKMAGFPRQARARPAAGEAKKRTSGRGARPDPSVVCPVCGAPMVKRKGPRGEFWGCSKFPACRGSRKLG
jgi:DNA topoisomerase-1